MDTPNTTTEPMMGLLRRREWKAIALKIIGVDPNERYRRQPQNLAQRAKTALYPAQVFEEQEPTVAEWLRELKPTKAGAAAYARDLVPSATWIGRYNLRWLIADSIAGLTIGFVVVPQAMAYAILARLSPEYGLYTSFVGAALYWVFGTSKDIVIGTTAVGSLLVGRVITKVEAASPDKYAAESIAKALSVITGGVLLFIGLFRLGWLIELIPYVTISSFITAASITIMSTQAPVVLGIQGINTRQAPYQVIINTLAGLGRTRLDAAIGITSIVLLFMLRDACAAMEKRHPARKRLWGTLSSMRQVFVMVLYTFISWAVHRHMPEGETKFRIVGKIEPGFIHAGAPTADSELLGLIAAELPAIVIILTIEHIAIAKSFGRIFDYTINPSQEIVALGAANLFSPFVGGYCCTGSFGASAVLSKSGVRTPLAGLYSAVILILALYALTAVFYYIPMAALGGLIIHAVSNLMTPPRSLYKYWQLSPLEVIIWVVGVSVAIFDSLEMSIYATIALSAALLLIRLSRSKGRFLGRVKVCQLPTAGPAGESEKTRHARVAEEVAMASRDVFLPLDRRDGSNPAVRVDAPYPGVFVYRFPESLNYSNQAHHVDSLLGHVMQMTRRTSREEYASKSDRLWNDPGPKEDSDDSSLRLPLLRAVVLDFSAVNNVDITSVQGLVDLRNTLDKHASPEAVEWHFASVRNRWARRALAVAGFGFPSGRHVEAFSSWKPAYDVAKLEDDHPVGPIAPVNLKRMPTALGGRTDTSSETYVEETGNPPAAGALFAVDRPFFHVDLTSAVDVSVRNARRKDEQIGASPSSRV